MLVRYLGRMSAGHIAKGINKKVIRNRGVGLALALAPL